MAETGENRAGTGEKGKKKLRILLRTFGCQMNTRDAEVIAGILQRAGFGIADSLDAADVVIFVTCAVRQHAEDKVWSEIGSICKRRTSRTKIENLAGSRKAGKDERRETIILTPHPGEMARLLGLSIVEVQNNRKGIAENFAKDYRVILVLKGHRTIVADYNGNLYINKTGNPGMSSAGTGDVLTGIIAALLGQGLTAFEAAKYGVYLHGLAGDLAAEEKTQISLIASDIIDKIPEAIKRRS